MSTAIEMTAAARAFLSGLGGTQRAAASRPISDDDVRRAWAYTPGERQGLALGDLDRAGRKAVHRLLATALRPHAHAQAAAIMALEDVLDRVEGGRRGRHSTDYWTLVFGEPGSGAWGWRFEGHHVSVNLTVVDGTVSGTPCFLGANPAVISHDGTVVSRPLAAEEELARALLDGMDTRGRTAAVVSDQAPPDLRTRAARRLGAPLEPLGVAQADLRGAAAALLDRLVATYAERLTFEVGATDRLHFAWEGSLTRGAGHYYRIQGPGLLVEYDNTQNGANHIHSVVRRPRGDFGEGL